jgi:phosphatidylethanolamine/phosphatidyl-N-methylethanolamine N-methyltransferase
MYRCRPMSRAATDLLLFARSLMAAPTAVAAISPSSRWLARAMAAGLGPHTGAVVEFGPGTGQLTQGLLEAGVAAADLTLFELDAGFTRLLRRRFADVMVHQACAQDALRHLPAGQAGAVVSGLPLLSLPTPVVEAVLHTAFTLLRPGGEMRQFTYGPRPPIAPGTLQRLGLVATPLRQVWANLPPARVYGLRRAQERLR